MTVDAKATSRPYVGAQEKKNDDISMILFRRQPWRKFICIINNRFQKLAASLLWDRQQDV